AIATIIALAFHISGFIAIGIFESSLFISLTPLNLLVCAVLIFWTQQQIDLPFLIFCLLAFGIGFGSEWVGINTGMLFGNYTYGKVLGPGFQGVPYLIGIQWLVVVYCAGICMAMLHQKLLDANKDPYNALPRKWIAVSMVADAALLALIFDWVLEPVAVYLGYWTWEGGEIPWLNYASWWGISALIMIFFHFLPFRKHNLFAVHLLMIQVMFFLLLRTFLLN
ncbi:MAG TPA: carotenoid biosynthesis protein, partial [Phnomibacter sp.]|nr:carotenoid biosynthesis protein [Phnomibacter sp.]